MASLFARALAGGIGGAAAGVTDIANTYLDSQMQQQRAQALAELQRVYAVKTAQDIDSFQNSPARREAMRAEAGKDTAAASAAELEARATQANDPRIRQGAIDTATATAAAQAAAVRDATKAGGADPEYLKSAKKIAEATRTPESAASLAQAELARFQTRALQRVDAIRTELAAAVQAGDGAKEKELRAKLDVFESKPGKEDKLRAAIDGAEKAMAPALKILADTMADPAAKKEAEETVRQARVRIDQYSKQLGIDNSKPAVPEAQAHKEAEAAIAAGAPREAVAKKLKEMGYAPLGGKPATPAAPATPTAPTVPTPPNTTNPGAPNYEPPADSPVGKYRANEAQRLRTEAEYRKQKTQEAADAFNNIAPGDIRAAGQLQSSELFKFLPLSQRAQIFKMVQPR
jgi:hypothetical protein